MFWNEGQLPENWAVETLIKKHPSKPYNPDIANAFFRSGYIESWGRGTIKMIERCTEAGVPTPSFSYEMLGIWVEFVKQLPKDVLTKKGLPKHLIKIILFTEKNGRVTNSDVQSICNITKRTATRYFLFSSLQHPEQKIKSLPSGRVAAALC
ncbi:MAG: transcriptional regulator, partial [Cytophagales bacterium]|nr:transcriptional regulator [Cytophagales bacterium]